MNVRVLLLRQFLLAFLLAVFTSLTLAADEDADVPILRIESGAHTAAIRALATDASGQYAVTASEDKTARVWEIASGHLLQVLRPPIGRGNVGKLYAATISPDGKIIAVAGWSKGNDVYVFERTSGRLINRVTGLPNVVAHLTFSPDGRMLAVSLWGRNGIRLYKSGDDWQSSREIASDIEYGGDSYGADFSRDGKRLITTSFDGMVRMYDVSEGRLRLLKSARPTGGEQPFSAVFSPDGSKIAVGFGDSSRIAILHAETLSIVYMPTVKGIDNGSLISLAWSSSGQLLCAAGSWHRAKGQHGLRCWKDAGAGAYTDHTIAGNTVVGLRALGDKQFIFASTDPMWGVVPAAGGEPLIVSKAGLSDFRGNRAAFRLAPDGSAVSFGNSLGRTAIAAFDLAKMEWTSPSTRWAAPLEKSGGLLIKQWFEGAQPVLNQHRLTLDRDEISLSAAVDGTHLVIGTSFYVRYFDRNGIEQWHVAAPGATWQVNLSRDGRWVVAAFSDGTLRWYRTRDGAEQLAFLPLPDRKRWVAWTPQGYYASSVGGENLVGWHINRGNVRAADFYPASRFRATYFRPDVIGQVLEKADSNIALQAANDTAGRKLEVARIDQSLPPVVAVLSPEDGSNVSAHEVTFHVVVRAPENAPATNLRVRVNGRIVDLGGSNNLSRANSDGGEIKRELHVPIPEKDSEVMVFAENKHGFSTPAVVRLRWTGALPSPAPAPTGQTAKAVVDSADTRPALYVLAIGISKYGNPAFRLEYPAKDATDFAMAFKSQRPGLYRKVVIKLLTDDKAKRDDVLDGLKWIRHELTSRDVGIVFMAGHGVNDNDGVYYYLPQDADITQLKRSAVVFTEIKNTLSTLPGKALFFVDTCHSGNVLGTGRGNTDLTLGDGTSTGESGMFVFAASSGLRHRNEFSGNPLNTNTRPLMRADVTAVVNELASAENGVIVFAASTGRQDALESPEWHNGAFTRSLLEGISGKADSMRSGRVTHKMLDLYTSERVKQLTSGSQSPVTIVPQGVPDFPLVITR